MKKFIENNFGLVIIITLIISFAFPPITKYFNNFPEYALMLVLFLAFLKIDYSHFIDILKKPFTVIFYVVINLFLLPVLFFWGFSALGMASGALAFMLISATPAPASSVVLSDLCKGDQNYALLTTLVSSVICPLSIPFLISLLTGSTIDVPFLSMFFKLFKIIIIPLAISIPFRVFGKKLIYKTKSYFSITSVLLLTIVLLGSVDGLQEKVFAELPRIPILLLISLIYFALKYALSFALGFWMTPKIKISYSIVSAFINIGLILVFTKNFFADVMGGEVLMFVVLTQILWNIALFPLQKISHWIINKNETLQR